MKTNTFLLLSAFLTVSTSAHVHAHEHEPKEGITKASVHRSSVIWRGARKCLQNPICRRVLVTIAAQLAECTGKLIVELATDAAMQVRELVGDIIWAPHDRAVLVTLDRLEAVLRQNGVYESEVQRHIEAMRVLHR